MWYSNLQSVDILHIYLLSKKTMQINDKDVIIF